MLKQPLYYASYLICFILGVVGVNASTFTISRRLREKNLFAGVAEEEDELTARHTRERLDFAILYANHNINTGDQRFLLMKKYLGSEKNECQ